MQTTNHSALLDSESNIDLTNPCYRLIKIAREKAQGNSKQAAVQAEVEKKHQEFLQGCTFTDLEEKRERIRKEEHEARKVQKKFKKQEDSAVQTEAPSVQTRFKLNSSLVKTVCSTASGFFVIPMLLLRKLSNRCAAMVRVRPNTDDSGFDLHCVSCANLTVLDGGGLFEGGARGDVLVCEGGGEIEEINASDEEETDEESEEETGEETEEGSGEDEKHDRYAQIDAEQMKSSSAHSERCFHDLIISNYLDANPEFYTHLNKNRLEFLKAAGEFAENGHTGNTGVEDASSENLARLNSFGISAVSTHKHCFDDRFCQAGGHGAWCLQFYIYIYVLRDHGFDERVGRTILLLPLNDVEAPVVVTQYNVLSDKQQFSMHTTSCSCAQDDCSHKFAVKLYFARNAALEIRNHEVKPGYAQPCLSTRRIPLMSFYEHKNAEEKCPMKPLYERVKLKLFEDPNFVFCDELCSECKEPLQRAGEVCESAVFCENGKFNMKFQKTICSTDRCPASTAQNLLEFDGQEWGLLHYSEKRMFTYKLLAEHFKHIVHNIMPSLRAFSACVRTDYSPELFVSDPVFNRAFCFFVDLLNDQEAYNCSLCEENGAIQCVLYDGLCLSYRLWKQKPSGSPRDTVPGVIKMATHVDYSKSRLYDRPTRQALKPVLGLKADAGFECSVVDPKFAELVSFLKWRAQASPRERVPFDHLLGCLTFSENICAVISPKSLSLSRQLISNQEQNITDKKAWKLLNNRAPVLAFALQLGKAMPPDVETWFLSVLAFADKVHALYAKAQSDANTRNAALEKLVDSDKHSHSRSGFKSGVGYRASGRVRSSYAYSNDGVPMSDPESKLCRDSGYKKGSVYSGGVMFAWCRHLISKGFHQMRGKESPKDVFYSLLCYNETIPPFVVYDNSCTLFVTCIEREWDLFKDVVMTTDWFHVKNHTGCSVAHSFRFLKLSGSEMAQDVASAVPESANKVLASLKQTVYSMNSHFAFLLVLRKTAAMNRKKRFQLEQDRLKRGFSTRATSSSRTSSSSSAVPASSSVAYNYSSTAAQSVSAS